jgi:hypothetical protein
MRNIVLVSPGGYMKILSLLFVFVASVAVANDAELLVRIPKSFVGNEVKNFINDHYKHDYYAVGYLSQKDVDALDASIKSHLQILDQETWAQGRYNIENLHVFPKMKEELEYHNYAAMTSLLQSMAAEYSDILTLKTAGRSGQGRELWYVILSDNPTVKENEPITTLIANMHGDETAGREVMLSFI